MSNDSFKLNLRAALYDFIDDTSLIDSVLQAVEKVSADYTIVSSIPSVPCRHNSLDVLDAYLTAKSVEEKSPGTIRTYRSYISAFLRFAGKSVNEITTSDIREYLLLCKNQKHYKDNSMETLRRCINGFFDFCCLEEIILKNPCKRIRPIRCEKKARTGMKLIELEYIRNSCRTLRERALVDYLYSTGCRVSEVCNVKLSDLDWENKTVIIRLGKGKVTRRTFLNPESEVSLRSYLASRASSCPYLFAREHGSSDKALTPKCIQDIIRKVVSRANITTHVTPHVFRHTLATVAIHNGMPVEHVQRLLGHANINTTMIYAQVDNDDVRLSHLRHLAS